MVSSWRLGWAPFSLPPAIVTRPTMRKSQPGHVVWGDWGPLRNRRSDQTTTGYTMRPASASEYRARSCLGIEPLSRLAARARRVPGESRHDHGPARGRGRKSDAAGRSGYDDRDFERPELSPIGRAAGRGSAPHTRRSDAREIRAGIQGESA
jgi:hypothetical protein